MSCVYIIKLALASIFPWYYQMSISRETPSLYIRALISRLKKKCSNKQPQKSLSNTYYIKKSSPYIIFYTVKWPGSLTCTAPVINSVVYKIQCDWKSFWHPEHFLSLYYCNYFFSISKQQLNSHIHSPPPEPEWILVTKRTAEDRPLLCLRVFPQT